MAVLCRGHDRARRLRLLQSGGGFVLFAHLLLAFTQTEIGVGILLVIALFGGLLTPYLVREIRRGKVELGLRQTWVQFARGQHKKKGPPLGGPHVPR